MVENFFFMEQFLISLVEKETECPSNDFTFY
jgi:hypothetical protein